MMAAAIQLQDSQLIALLSHLIEHFIALLTVVFSFRSSFFFFIKLLFSCNYVGKLSAQQLMFIVSIMISFDSSLQTQFVDFIATEFVIIGKQNYRFSFELKFCRYLFIILIIQNFKISYY